MRSVRYGVGAILALAALGVGRAFAEPLVARPDDVRVDEHLGDFVPLDASFTDAHGRPVRLRELFQDGKPVLLVLAYERCPLLCGIVLSNAVKSVKALDRKLGRDFRCVTISFDPEEKPEAAHRRQATLLAELRRDDTPHVWPFLTGDAASIEALTRSVGFLVYHDPSTGEYAHPAVMVVLTPEGKISRYLYGVESSPRDLSFAIVEAGEGRTGTTLERILLTCYRYDPTTHRYGLAIARLARVTGLFVLASVSLLLGTLWRRERRRHA